MRARRGVLQVMGILVLGLFQVAAPCSGGGSSPISNVILSGPTSLGTTPSTYTVRYTIDPSVAAIATVWLVEEAQGTNTGGGVFSWITDTFTQGQTNRSVSLHLFCVNGQVMGADSFTAAGTPVTDCRFPHVACSPNNRPNGPCSCEQPNGYQPNNPNSGLSSAHVHAEVFQDVHGLGRVPSNTLIINCT